MFGRKFKYYIAYNLSMIKAVNPLENKMINKKIRNLQKIGNLIFIFFQKIKKTSFIQFRGAKYHIIRKI